MMSPCAECRRPLWPFALAIAISGLVGFLTWLMLGLVDIPTGQRAVVTTVSFLVVLILLLRYVLTCLKRHCRH